MCSVPRHCLLYMKYLTILIISLLLSYSIIKVDRVFKPTIAYSYYLTDDLKENKSLSKILLDILKHKRANKTEFEEKIFKYISGFLKTYSNIVEEKNFQIIIDLPESNQLAFYVVNEDVGLNPPSLTRGNEIRRHLNPSRLFSFDEYRIKSFKQIIENEVEFLHKRSQALYSAIKNIRPLLSPVVISPYLYSSGLAKKDRYYNEICHVRNDKDNNAGEYTAYVFESKFIDYESSKDSFSIESRWEDQNIRGSAKYTEKILTECKFFEVESQDKLERSNKLTKILGFRVSEFQLFFKPSPTSHLKKINFQRLHPRGISKIIKSDSKLEQVVNFFVGYIKRIDTFLVIESGFIEVIGGCEDLIEELNEQYPVKTLDLRKNRRFFFRVGKEKIAFTISETDTPKNCRIMINS